MPASVSDMVRMMERLAPSRLAEDWDNPGLQVGQGDWPVRKIWTALDPLPDVVDAACKAGADILITHHPLIFAPLKRLDFSTPVGSILRMACENRLAIFSAHTNLDSASGGLNDIFASKIGLENLRPLIPAAKRAEMFKLVMYVPLDHERKMLDRLFEAGAGKIGPYSCCTFRQRGTGTFKPGPRARPFSGKIGEISHADESRIELVASGNELSELIALVKATHPYETPAYDVYPLKSSENGEEGIGRVGEIGEPAELASFALRIKACLGLESVRIAGKRGLPIRSAAICTGSGSGLMKAFFASRAQVYVSGDLRYHDARDAEAAGRGLIDVGHFASEHLIAEALAERLRKMLSEAGKNDVQVEACLAETDPFITL